MRPFWNVCFVQVFTQRHLEWVVDGVFRVFRRHGDLRDVYAIVRETDAEKGCLKEVLFRNDSRD